jgi:hypothetical protein
MPNLQWNRTTAATASEKAVALGQKFFPKVDADLTDITDPELAIRAAIELNINRQATEWEVYTVLKRAEPDKFLGLDEIPNRVLQAMGEPLVQALTALINQCWAAEYFPKRF